MNFAFCSRDSLVHFLDPRAKLLFVFTCFISVVFVKNPGNQRDSIVIAEIAGYKDSSVYNVTVLEKSVVETSDLDMFNAADVVIIGRSIGSSDVDVVFSQYLESS